MITAIGNPVYDYIKTQRVQPKGRVLSGCSTNAALALAKLGERVRLVGAVGDDFKSQFVRDLSRYGIHYEVLPSNQTGGFSLNYYDDYGNRTLDLLGRADPIEPPDPAWYADARAVLIGPILGEISFADIAEIRRRFQGLFFCDPQGLLRGADGAGRIYHERTNGIEEVLGRFDIVKPNELEGEILTGINCRDNPYEAARIIKSWGPKVVIITLAELGSLVYDGHDFIDIPAYRVDLVDATGSGDVYMAGFTFEYLKTVGDLRAAGCFASATSSIMIEHVGPDFPMTEAAVRSRQEELLRVTDFRLDVGVNSARG
ncbi:MAG TPA: PfkB family carbohydrate kinase [Candidatus Deferrimicrobium sp.]|nr:PfkB family carbohydrate kinase [Candidatus Deferrimicrobium sp.]